jgi:hypothetical protein
MKQKSNAYLMSLPTKSNAYPMFIGIIFCPFGNIDMLILSYIDIMLMILVSRA